MLAYLLGLLKSNIATIISLKGKNVKLIAIIFLTENMSWLKIYHESKITLY